MSFRSQVIHPHVIVMITFSPSLLAETEESGLELRKLIESKAGEVTDVIASIGGYKPNGPMLSQPLEQLQEVSNDLNEILFKGFDQWQLHYACNPPSTPEGL